MEHTQSATGTPFVILTNVPSLEDLVRQLWRKDNPVQPHFDFNVGKCVITLRSERRTVEVRYEFDAQSDQGSIRISAQLVLLTPTGQYLASTTQHAEFHWDEISDVLATYLSCADMLTIEEFVRCPDLPLEVQLDNWMKEFNPNTTSRPSEMARGHVREFTPEEARKTGVVVNPAMTLPKKLCPWPFAQIRDDHELHPLEVPSTIYPKRAEGDPQSPWDQMRMDEYERRVIVWKAQAYAILVEAMHSQGETQTQVESRYRISPEEILWLMKGRIDKFSIEKLNELVIRAGFTYDVIFKSR